MKRVQMGAFVVALAVSSLALAEGGGDRTFELAFGANAKAMGQYAAEQGKAAPVVREYEYGMKRDVVNKALDNVDPAG